MDDSHNPEDIILPQTISDTLTEKNVSNCSVPLSTSVFYPDEPDSYEKLLKRDRKKRKLLSSKRNDILEIIEKYKLKDKSISKKLNTPYDRKLERTCWPIQMQKVCRIKEKPTVKEKEKPDNESLTKKKFSDPSLFCSSGPRRRRRGTVSDSD